MKSLVPADQARAEKIEPDCAIHKGGCQKAVAERLVGLDIFPKPVKAMTDLTFRVTLSGEPPPRPPYIDLGMPGMHMGPNRVILEKVSAGTYEGRGVIVRCPSGKKIWRATISIPEAGTVDFTFDVVY